MPADRVRIGLLAADLTHRHGWAHYSLSLLQALGRAGADVSVLAPTNSPLVEGVRVLPILPTLDPLQGGMLARQLARVGAARSALADCHIIHSAVELYAPLAAVAAGSRPLVITAHGTYVRLPRRGGVSGWMYRRAFARSTLACVSHFTASEAERILPGARTVVIPNGIDSARFDSLPPAHRQGSTVLFVGAVKPRKGVLPLVRAIARVRERIPDVRCLIAGALDQEPAYVAQVREAIAANGLEESVQLLGRLSAADLLPLYAAADVFALPSLNLDGKFEGFGLALLEASAAGLPVIGSRGCGAEDAVRHGQTGLLIRQAEIEAELTEALLQLLTRPDERLRMGAAGRAFAQAQTWDAAAQALIGLYQRLLLDKQ
jgi:phosphatidylinositol alpha-1,6-mannosyltransferase